MLVWACVLKPWTTWKVPLLWAREATTETDWWIGIDRQGEESSAPLSWSTEKPPSLGGSRAADGHTAALSSQGVYHFSDYLDADTHVGEEPLLWLAPVFFMHTTPPPPTPLFFLLQLLLKITGNLSCNLAGTLVDCLLLFLPFDTDVLGHVLPCAPDFLWIYRGPQRMIKTFNHRCDSTLTCFLVIAKKG